LHRRIRRGIVARMAKNTWSNEDLKTKRASPGWRLEAGDTTHEGTLDDVARIAHERHQRGEHPGVIREIATWVELEMIQLEKLWMAMGLPMA